MLKPGDRCPKCEGADLVVDPDGQSLVCRNMCGFHHYPQYAQNKQEMGCEAVGKKKGYTTKPYKAREPHSVAAFTRSTREE